MGTIGLCSSRLEWMSSIAVITMRMEESFMTEKQLDYYKGDSASAPYIADLYRGKIHIYDVPFQFRTKTAYIGAFTASTAVWDGTDRSNRLRLEMELIAMQAKKDIIEASRQGLNSRAESIKMFYISNILNSWVKDERGRRFNYDGGYLPE